MDTLRRRDDWAIALFELWSLDGEWLGSKLAMIAVAVNVSRRIAPPPRCPFGLSAGKAERPARQQVSTPDVHVLQRRGIIGSDIGE